MRISIVAGFLLPIPPVQGGAMEKTWHRFAEEFVRAGHTVTFISRRWPGWADNETIAGVRHVRIPGADHTRYLWLNLLLDFIWGLRVTRALPVADIVITNTVALPVWLRRLKPSAGRVVAAIARMPKGQIRFYGGVDLLLSLSPRPDGANHSRPPDVGCAHRAFSAAHRLVGTRRCCQPTQSAHHLASVEHRLHRPAQS